MALRLTETTAEQGVRALKPSRLTSTLVLPHASPVLVSEEAGAAEAALVAIFDTGIGWVVHVRASDWARGSAVGELLVGAAGLGWKKATTVETLNQPAPQAISSMLTSTFILPHASSVLVSEEARAAEAARVAIGGTESGRVVHVRACDWAGGSAFVEHLIGPTGLGWKKATTVETLNQPAPQAISSMLTSTFALPHTSPVLVSEETGAAEAAPVAIVGTGIGWVVLICASDRARSSAVGELLIGSAGLGWKSGRMISTTIKMEELVCTSNLFDLPGATLLVLFIRPCCKLRGLPAQNKVRELGRCSTRTAGFAQLVLHLLWSQTATAISI